MKLLCPRCQRLGPPVGWAVIDGELRLRCACGERSTLPARMPPAPPPGEPVAPPAEERATPAEPPAPSPATPEPPPAEPLRLVPPPPPGREADTPGQTLPVSIPSTGGDEVPDAWLDAAWADLLRRWDEPDAHRRVLNLAEARDALPDLGRRYKERIDRDPRDERAIAGRDELIRRATARLLVETSPRAAGPTVRARNVIVATVILSAVALIVLAIAQFARSGVAAP